MYIFDMQKALQNQGFWSWVKARGFENPITQSVGKRKSPIFNLVFANLPLFFSFNIY